LFVLKRACFYSDNLCIWLEEVNGTVNKKGVTGTMVIWILLITLNCSLRGEDAGKDWRLRTTSPLVAIGTHDVLSEWLGAFDTTYKCVSDW